MKSYHEFYLESLYVVKYQHLWFSMDNLPPSGQKILKTNLVNKGLPCNNIISTQFSLNDVCKDSSLKLYF